MEIPFFSVCIPVTDREETIYNTLSSVARQTFRDFEVIVVECGSKDKSREEIDRFFACDDYKDAPFPYNYVKNDWTPKTIEDWNEPLKLASGKYIAMLEGDDQYLPKHLEHAYDILCTHDNVGLVGDGNQLRSRKIQGFVQNSEFLQYILHKEEVVPPSESIFIRTDKDGIPFLYDDQSYEYAPEGDLYTRIALSGFDMYNAGYNEVVRRVSPSKKITWHYDVDSFTFLNKYKEYYNSKEYKRMKDGLVKTTFRRTDKSFSNIMTVTKGIVHFTSAICFLKGMINFFLYKMHIVD